MPIECLSAGILFADVVGSPIERAPQAGELAPAERIELSLGGCAANAALDLARLGVQVGAAGCVGKDVFGQFIIEKLRSGGVDVGGVSAVAGPNTACTMIINVRGEDRRFVSSIGANAAMSVAHLPEAWLAEASVFYLGGYLMLPGMETAALAEVLNRLRQRGCITVIDVVYVGSPNSLNALSLVLPHTDYFLPNDDEAVALTGLADPVAQAEAFRSMGAKTVVITCGEKGSVLVGPEFRFRAGVYPTEFVGGTGAGDAFDAGFIMGLLRREDPISCVRWGSALGASCVRAASATDAVFTREEAEEFIARHPLPIEPLP